MKDMLSLTISEYYLSLIVEYHYSEKYFLVFYVVWDFNFHWEKMRQLFYHTTFTPYR